MSDVTWLSLCLDVNGPEVGAFWAAALGGDLRPGEEPGWPDAVWGPDGPVLVLCPVPEPKAVKHRVHLDVHTDAVESLLDLGATVLRPADDEIGWTVLADPEGGELCAFVRASPPAPPDLRLYEVGVDCRDPEALARWWGERLGVEAGHDPDHPWWSLADVPGAPFDALVLAPVTEPKTAKNRLHWDVRGDVGVLERAGATVLSHQSSWTVMADPEGNEFCVFPPEAP